MFAGEYSGDRVVAERPCFSRTVFCRMFILCEHLVALVTSERPEYFRVIILVGEYTR